LTVNMNVMLILDSTVVLGIIFVEDGSNC